MRFCAPATLLQRALRCASKGRTRKTLPVLENVLLKASADGRLRATCTDLHIAACWTVPVQVERAGEYLLPIIPLLEMVDEMPADAVVTVSIDETSWRATFSLEGAFQGSLSAGNASEFPDPFSALHGGLSTPIAEVHTSLISSIYRRTAYAVSEDRARLSLNGILLEPDGADLLSVATDGKALALVRSPTPGMSSFAPLIIPPKLLQVHLSSAPGETTRISAQETVAIFLESEVGDGIRLECAARCIDGPYPSYRQLFRVKGDSSWVVIDVPVTMAALARAEVARKAAHGISGARIIPLSGWMQGGRNGGRLRIEIDGPDGSSSEEIPVLDLSTPPPSTWHANPLLLIDALSRISSGQARLGFGDLATSYIDIQPVNGFSERHLVMPIKAAA